MRDPWPIGLQLKEREYLLTEARIRDYMIAIDASDNPLYRGHGTRVCPAALLCFQPALFPDWPKQPQRQAFNARNEWVFHKPTRPGQTLTLTGRVSDRWLKRGKEYFTIDMRALSVDRQTVASCLFTEAVTQPPAYDPPLEDRTSQKSELRAESRGAELGTLARTYSVEMSKAIAGPGPDWHTDREMARARGYDEPVLLGAQFVCQMSELMTRIFGYGFLQGGSISVNGLRPVLVGERITARAFEYRRLREPDGATRIEVAIWCENDRGEKIAAGIAGARETPEPAQNIVPM